MQLILISAWAGFLPVLVALGVSLAVGWQRYRHVQAALGGWRNRLLLLGMVVNTLSLAMYLADLGRFALIRRGVVGYTGVGWPDSFVVLVALLGISTVAAVCGAFGRGTARVLTTANGLVLCALWYLLGLGTSV